MKIFCSAPFLKKIIALFLTLTTILIVVNITRNVLATYKTQAVYDVKTEIHPIGKESSGQIGGLRSAVGDITKLLKTSISGNTNTEDLKDSSQFGVNNSNFHAALRRYASKDGLIYLSSVDSGYLELALNLYFSSFKKLGITNYLFVGSDSKLCESMSEYDIQCFDYIHDKDAKTPSGYFSKAFKRKTHLKTKIILEALKLGLKVIITDVDIVFLKDPTPHLNCADCDIEISSDVVEGNSGFYIARPTEGAIKLHTDAWAQGLAKPEISNQKAVDRLMERMKRGKKLKVKNLDPKTFANGKVFFEDNGRMFAGDNPCPNCVIVHNNWIVSAQAKIYRFKEYGLWESDYQGYYSSPTRKYLTFDLPLDFGGKDTRGHELRAMQSALTIANILNRTLILPKFHCYGCKFNKACTKKDSKCTFGTFFRIDQLDKEFKDGYRESTFLRHHIVPESVKSSVSPKFLIQSGHYKAKLGELQDDVEILAPDDESKGPTVVEIRRWFSNETVSILKFHSMYTSLNIDNQDSLVHRVKASLKSSDSRQYS